MINRPPFSSSNSRTTQRQQTYDKLIREIIDQIKDFEEAQNAETIWLAMKAKGSTLSYATFNAWLKRIVEADEIEKITVKYNTYLYREAGGHQDQSF